MPFGNRNFRPSTSNTKDQTEQDKIDQAQIDSINQISYELLKDQNTFLKNIQKAKQGNFIFGQQLQYITGVKEASTIDTFETYDNEFLLQRNQGTEWSVQKILSRLDQQKEKIFKKPEQFTEIYDQFKRAEKIHQTPRFFMELLLKSNNYSDIQIQQYFQIAEGIGVTYENKLEDFFEQTRILLDSFKPDVVYLSQQDLKAVLLDPNTVQQVSQKLQKSNPNIIIVEDESKESMIIQFSSITRIKNLLVSQDIPIQNNAFANTYIIDQNQVFGQSKQFHHHHFYRDNKFRLETLKSFSTETEAYAFNLAQEFEEKLIQSLKTKDLKSISDQYNKVPGFKNSKKTEIKSQIKQYENELKYFEIVNLVPAIKVFKDIGIQQNPLSATIYKGIQETNILNENKKSDLNESFVQYKEIDMHGKGERFRDNIIPQNIKDYIQQQYNDPNLPLNEEQIQAIFNQGKFINYSQFDIKESEDSIEKVGIKSQKMDDNKILDYFKGREKNFTYEKYQFAQKVIFDRIQDFFKRSNVQSIEKLVQLYDNLSAEYRKTQDPSTLEKVNFAIENIKKVKDVFSEVFEEAKILISGGGEILNYIKTKVDYDVIKDVAKPLFDITNSEAVGSSYAKQFFVLADKFWELKKNGSGNDLKAYFKVLQENETFQQFKNNVEQNSDSFWGKVSSYYKSFKTFIQSDYVNTIMNYFQKFLPLLKDILRVTVGVTLPSEAIIMGYAQDALETVQSFMSDDVNTTRKLSVINNEYYKNEILENQRQQVMDYFD